MVKEGEGGGGTYKPKVPLPPFGWGRLVIGQRGSEVFRGMHMGKPEKEVMLGLWSSAVIMGMPL